MKLYILQLLYDLDFYLRLEYTIDGKRREEEELQLKELWNELKIKLDDYLINDRVEDVNWKQARDVFIRGNKMAEEEDKSRVMVKRKIRHAQSYKPGELFKNSVGWHLKLKKGVKYIRKSEYGEYGIDE